MPQTGSEREAAQASFRGAARAPFIPGDTVGSLPAPAAPGQVAARAAMLESEIARRDRSRRARPLRQARFPVPKSAEGFDWSNVAFPDGWGRDETPSPALARDAGDPVFCGQAGRGGTHMATALGIAAASAGHPARLWQTAQPVLRLGRAKREGALGRPLADAARARLLVLDEFGHVPLDAGGAGPLHQVTSDGYERGSVTFAANVEFGRRGTVFADDELAAAIAGRVVHHGRLAGFGGPSHRLEGSLVLGKSGRWRRRRARDEARKSRALEPERKTCSKGTAVGILDQSGTGGEPHVQPGAEEARDRDLHQIRP